VTVNVPGATLLLPLCCGCNWQVLVHCVAAAAATSAAAAAVPVLPAEYCGRGEAISFWRVLSRAQSAGDVLVRQQTAGAHLHCAVARARC
jgi:hypothetical protein